MSDEERTYTYDDLRTAQNIWAARRDLDDLLDMLLRADMTMLRLMHDNRPGISPAALRAAKTHIEDAHRDVGRVLEKLIDADLRMFGFPEPPEDPDDRDADGEYMPPENDRGSIETRMADAAERLMRGPADDEHDLYPDETRIRAGDER